MPLAAGADEEVESAESVLRCVLRQVKSQIGISSLPVLSDDDAGRNAPVCSVSTRDSADVPSITEFFSLRYSARHSYLPLALLRR